MTGKKPEINATHKWWYHEECGMDIPAGSNRRLGVVMQHVAVECALSTNPPQVHKQRMEQRPGMFLMIRIALAFRCAANTNGHIGQGDRDRILEQFQPQPKQHFTANYTRHFRGLLVSRIRPLSRRNFGHKGGYWPVFASNPARPQPTNPGRCGYQFGQTGPSPPV